MHPSKIAFFILLVLTAVVVVPLILMKPGDGQCQVGQTTRRFMVSVALLLASLLFCAAVSGCSSAPPLPPPPVLIPPTTKANIPADTLRDCDPLPRMEDRAYTQEQTLDYLESVVTVQTECRARKRNATKALKDAVNQK